MIFEEMFSQPLCNLMILYSVDLSVPTVMPCLLSLSFFVFFSALRGRHKKDKEHILLIIFFHNLSVLHSHIAGLALNVQVLLPQTHISTQCFSIVKKLIILLKRIKPGVLQIMGPQRVGHDLVTEHQQENKILKHLGK